MSRAEQRTFPPAPRLGRALRVAAEDLYYHGVRLVVANLVWGIVALVAAFAASRSAFGLVALVAMVPPTVGLMGMATALVRERNVVMSDFGRPMRGRLWGLLALGVGQFVLFLLAAFDLVLGIQLGGMLGLVLAIAGFYSVVVLWVLAVVIWPIIADPERRAEPMRSTIRLGALLVLAHPVRMGLLALVLAILTVVSTILVAAIVTFAAAYIALAAAHYVLPAADRLEGRATHEVAD